MNILTADEIKSLLDAAGVKHRLFCDEMWDAYYMVDRPYAYVEVEIDDVINTCGCDDEDHRTVDEAYQCIWESYINGELT
jgi:hypothetical protein